MSSKSWHLVTKTRRTADALGAKSCSRDHYHKPLEGIDVTLSAGYTAQVRRAVVSLVLAPEWKTYEDILAVLEGTKEDSLGKTGPFEKSLTSPVFEKIGSER